MRDSCWEKERTGEEGEYTQQDEVGPPGKKTKTALIKVADPDPNCNPYMYKRLFIFGLRQKSGYSLLKKKEEKTFVRACPYKSRYLQQKNA